MAKSAYEIRLDVLAIARDMLESNKQAAEKAYSTAMAAGMHSEIDVAKERVLGSNYTEEDVITKANTLYSFVNNNTKT